MEKGFNTNSGVVAVFSFDVYSKMESWLEDLSNIPGCHVVTLVLISLLCGIEINSLTLGL